jgi:hypothetical protein
MQTEFNGKQLSNCKQKRDLIAAEYYHAQE